jgi:hypothetical protein
MVSAFQCPSCGGSMREVDVKSLVCTKNHTFDFTKQGYVNMMTRPTYSHYDKELFEARFHTIIESNLFNEMQKTIANVIKERVDNFHLKYSKVLKKAELNHLVQITPVSWSSVQANIEAFKQQDSAEITVDLEILVGVKK